MNAGMNTEKDTEHWVPLNEFGGPIRERSGLADTARGVALEGVRRWGSLTSSLRMTPDYLIIGTKRGGSTSLARWVTDHPNVRPLFPARETRKGTYFFDVNYERGEAWYRSHFPTKIAHQIDERRAGESLIVGEATPYYLYHPHAAIRARRILPRAKVIALLRNPVDRAVGHWGERTRNGVEWLDLPEALAAEEDRTAGEEARMIADPAYQSYAHQHFTYVDQSRYAKALKRWMDVWPSQQLLVLRAEDMYANPSEVYAQVTEFLGLPTWEPEGFAAWNQKPRDPIAPEIDKLLSDQLRGSVTELEELLGRSMNWDLLP